MILLKISKQYYRRGLLFPPNESKFISTIIKTKFPNLSCNSLKLPVTPKKEKKAK